MYKSIFAAVLGLGIVIGGSVLHEGGSQNERPAAAGVAIHHAGDQAAANADGGEGGGEAHGSSSHHEHTEGQKEGSEVYAYIQADSEGIDIFLKDSQGRAVDDLAVNHEKLLHLIVVDEQLQHYYHVHPQRVGAGEFRSGQVLPAGFYRAFIDIKPTRLAYQVAPVPLVVGHPKGSSPAQGLQPDPVLQQTIDGESVRLRLSSTIANEPVTLTFELDRSGLAPYLGAMGHVVILDERANHYVHVHPLNQAEPVFQTEFQEPGLYKIWAEFQQNGKVRAFPFVVRIRGE